MTKQNKTKLGKSPYYSSLSAPALVDLAVFVAATDVSLLVDPIDLTQLKSQLQTWHKALLDQGTVRGYTAECVARISADTYLIKQKLTRRVLPVVRFRQFPRTTEFLTGGWKGRRLPV